MEKLSSLLPPQLLYKMRLFNRLTTDIRNYLAPVSNEQVSVVGFEDGKLRLLVNNATMATMLRYQQKELLKHLNTDPALNIKTISVSVSSSLK